MRGGDTVGAKYLVAERIGEGGYGDVWRATGSVGGVSIGEVAIKEFRGAANRGELDLLLRLSHPNLVALRGVEQHEGRLCLVMEYAEGGSAAELLQSYPQGVPLEHVERVMRDVAAGLAYLHSKGIVHRDVKPANVVFSDGVAKLCDMGLAKVMLGVEAQHTGHGTVAYSAPELFGQQPTATPAVDMYALGVLAYEMLLGRLPYGANTAQIVSGTLQPEPVPLTTIPARLLPLLVKCLAKPPGDPTRSGSM